MAEPDDRPLVLNIGLHPDLVAATAGGRASFTDVDADAVRRGLESARADADELGVELEDFLVERGTDVVAELGAVLRARHVAYAVIGGGVRFEPGLTRLFEELVDTVRRTSPETFLCFNTGPGTTIDAVRRWW